jgi:hypothetical protein
MSNCVPRNFAQFWKLYPQRGSLRISPIPTPLNEPVGQNAIGGILSVSPLYYDILRSATAAAKEARAHRTLGLAASQTLSGKRITT